MVADVVGASETDEQIPNQPPPPPVEVFNTTMSNGLEWLVADALTEAGKLYYVFVEKRFSKFGWVTPPVKVTNSELPHEYLICDFSSRLPENPYSLYLNMVGIIPSPNIIIMKKIGFCNYAKNNEDDKDKGEVDYDGDVGPFFHAIAYEKCFDGGKDNPTFVGNGETCWSQVSSWEV